MERRGDGGRGRGVAANPLDALLWKCISINESQYVKDAHYFLFYFYFAFPKPWIAGRLCNTDSFFSPKTFTRGHHVAVGNGLSKTVTRDYVKALKHVNCHPPIENQFNYAYCLILAACCSCPWSHRYLSPSRTPLNLHPKDVFSHKWY